MGKKKSPDESLPYFKFVILKWITGDISECSLSAQGLFINLCALYWSKQGKLSLSAMKRKFPRKSKLFSELLERGILKSNEADLVISFLDEQLTERGLVSVKNRKNIQEYWNQKKSDTTVSLSNNEPTTNVIPTEEKREEENRTEQKREDDALISGNGFEYEFSENVPREGLDLVDALCDYFSVKKIVTSPVYNSVYEYAASISHRNEIPMAVIALQKYMAYKARSQEQIHGIEKWIGTKENHYQDGVWFTTDWEKKNKTYNGTGTSTKGTSGKISTEPYAGKPYNQEGF